MALQESLVSLGGAGRGLTGGIIGERWLRNFSNVHFSGCSRIESLNRKKKKSTKNIEEKITIIDNNIEMIWWYDGEIIYCPSLDTILLMLLITYSISSSLIPPFSCMFLYKHEVHPRDTSKQNKNGTPVSQSTLVFLRFLRAVATKHLVRNDEPADFVTSASWRERELVAKSTRLTVTSAFVSRFLSFPILLIRGVHCALSLFLNLLFYIFDHYFSPIRQFYPVILVFVLLIFFFLVFFLIFSSWITCRFVVSQRTTRIQKYKETLVAWERQLAFADR